MPANMVCFNKSKWKSNNRGKKRRENYIPEKINSDMEIRTYRQLSMSFQSSTEIMKANLTLQSKTNNTRIAEAESFISFLLLLFFFYVCVTATGIPNTFWCPSAMDNTGSDHMSFYPSFLAKRDAQGGK